VIVKYNVPKKVSSINSEVVKNQGNQKVDYNESTNSVEWSIRKMPGDTEYTMMTKITLPNATSAQAMKETGPINLTFEIPNFNLSGLQIKSLKSLMSEENPNKWVRYITKTSSYVCRI
jgi:AP-4 complex subunit mu-1